MLKNAQRVFLWPTPVSYTHLDVYKRQVLSLMAMLSINIGIFNLIPIPALDGGKILINLIEVVRRKPLKQEVETYMTLAGVAVMRCV